MRGLGGKRSVACAVAFACCALALLGAVLALRGHIGDGRGEADSDALGDAVLGALARGDGRDVQCSSIDEFLGDLEDARDGAGDGGVRIVELEDDGGLVCLASEMLGVYRGAQEATLETSGYLDLAGNAWGAVLRGRAGWIDVVAVFERGDGSGLARVARLGEG